MRAPFQVLIFPYKPKGEKILFLICLRSDLGFWQPISGGGEDAETSLEAAKRELFEETAPCGCELATTRLHVYTAENNI